MATLTLGVRLGMNRSSNLAGQAKLLGVTLLIRPRVKIFVQRIGDGRPTRFERLAVTAGLFVCGDGNLVRSKRVFATAYARHSRKSRAPRGNRTGPWSLCLLPARPPPPYHTPAGIVNSRAGHKSEGAGLLTTTPSSQQRLRRQTYARLTTAPRSKMQPSNANKPNKMCEMAEVGSIMQPA
jgi:hypothetical protein